MTLTLRGALTGTVMARRTSGVALARDHVSRVKGRPPGAPCRSTGTLPATPSCETHLGSCPPAQALPAERPGALGGRGLMVASPSPALLAGGAAAWLARQVVATHADRLLINRFARPRHGRLPDGIDLWACAAPGTT